MDKGDIELESLTSGKIESHDLDLFLSALDFYELQIFKILAETDFALNTNQIYIKVVNRSWEYFLTLEPKNLDKITKEEVKKIEEAFEKQDIVTWLKLLRKRKNLGLAVPSYKKVETILKDLNEKGLILKRGIKRFRGGKIGSLWILHPQIIKLYNKRKNELLSISEAEADKISNQIFYFYNLKKKK